MVGKKHLLSVMLRKVVEKLVQISSQQLLYFNTSNSKLEANFFLTGKNNAHKEE